MSIHYSCPRCKTALKASELEAGQWKKCSACGAAVSVPGASTRGFKGGPTPSPVNAEHAPTTVLPGPTTKLAGHEDLVDMTAMVDIVFFLLIFFMVTVVQDVMSSIETPPPDAQKGVAQGRREAADEPDADALAVRIDADDTVWLDGEQILGEQELRARFRAARRGESLGRVHVEGHGDARHQTLVMVLDAAYSVGVEELAVSVVEEEGTEQPPLPLAKSR